MLSLNAVKTSVVAEENASSVEGVFERVAQALGREFSCQLEAVITDWSFFSLQGMKELRPSPLEIRLINDVIAAFCVGSDRFSEQLLASALSNYAFYPEFVNRVLNAAVREMTLRNIDTEDLLFSYTVNEQQEKGLLEIHFGKNDRHASVEFSIPSDCLLLTGEQSVVDEFIEIVHSNETTENKVEMLAGKVSELIDALLISQNAENIDALNRIVIAVEDQSGYHFKLANDLRIGNYVEYSEEYGSVVICLLDTYAASAA